MAQQYPFGVNAPMGQQTGAYAHLANPFSMPPNPPWVPGNRHGSEELGGRARSFAERARPRSRERERRTVSPVTRTPLSARAYRQRTEGVEQEVRFDDLDA